jgi:hypothetical protein
MLTNVAKLSPATHFPSTLLLVPLSSFQALLVVMVCMIRRHKFIFSLTWVVEAGLLSLI